MGDYAEFYRLLAKHYRAEREAVAAKNTALWDIVIDFVREIGEAESDGSSITNLKQYAEVQADKMRELIR